jgi:hypothetical protein
VNRRDSNAFEVSPRVRPSETVVVPLPDALNMRTTLLPTSASETRRTTLALNLRAIRQTRPPERFGSANATS